MNRRKVWPMRARIGMLAALIGVVLSWQAFWAAPTAARHAALLNAEQVLRAQRAAYRNEQTALLITLRALAAARDQRDSATLHTDSLTPEQPAMRLDTHARMALLATLAAETPGLVLLSLTSATTPTTTDQPALQRHRVAIEVEGGFFALLAYLEALEALPWALTWEHVDIAVSDAGPPRMQLSLSTLESSQDSVHV